MRIFIPSSNRPLKQTTYDNLPLAIQREVAVIVPHDQFRIYSDAGLPAFPTPPNIRGIGPTRQWICDAYGGHVLMLDDDLVFATRRLDDRTKFRDSTPEEIIDLIAEIEDTMNNGYAHGAVAPREGGNRNTDSVLFNTRCLRALFYNADILKKHNIRFTDMEVMEDFHVALSLLRLGHPSITLNHMVQNQNGSNLPGGCSVYRTLDVQARSAARLAELHPDFVKVVTKTTKTAWGGETRTDVRVSWKAAYMAGAARHEAPSNGL